ncbi:MAG: response regulator transcription factor [Candidatus Cloacimonetes bacterium]|nr:response regulator transcription factor [Candidatus Cloacimonadota bacterium]
MRILLVEDDKKIAGFIAKGLQEENYAIDIFHNGDDGLYWALVIDYDLIILDIMLPQKNGLEICREIRDNQKNTPIIILTAKVSIEDKVKGLQTGADDYLSKPFSFDELLARIQALLRRSQEYHTQVLSAVDLELDISSRRVFRAGKEIFLSGREYGLLEFLLRNKNKIVTETQIIEHVWDMNSELFTNVVNVYIHHLRKKIDDNNAHKLIYTLRGRGYILKDK